MIHCWNFAGYQVGNNGYGSSIEGTIVGNLWASNKVWYFKVVFQARGCFEIRRALMVTQHCKVGCSDTKFGKVSTALLQRGPLGYLEEEAIKDLGKVRTMAKMVTQHCKVGCYDTKFGKVSIALLQREPLGYLGLRMSRQE